MLTLNLLRQTRLSKGITPKLLAGITTIKRDRYIAIECNRVEPWLGEAAQIAHALCTDGILPLVGEIASLDALQLDDPQLTAEYLATYRSGLPVPLRAAMAIARHMGLPDPITLHTDASTRLMRELWTFMQAGTHGQCPWCAGILTHDREASGAVAGHASTCLPNNLFAVAPASDILVPVIFKPQSRADRMKGRKAPGLRPLRLARGWTQKDVERHSGVLASYYAHLEKLRLPLTEAKATQLARAFKCDRATLYLAP